MLAVVPIVFHLPPKARFHLPPKTRFPEMERNAELEWAAVSGEDRYVTTLITAAKETTYDPAKVASNLPCLDYWFSGLNPNIRPIESLKVSSQIWNTWRMYSKHSVLWRWLCQTLCTAAFFKKRAKVATSELVATCTYLNSGFLAISENWSKYTPWIRYTANFFTLFAL